jgi:hypothetical protein
MYLEVERHSKCSEMRVIVQEFEVLAPFRVMNKLFVVAEKTRRRPNTVM